MQSPYLKFVENLKFRYQSPVHLNLVSMDKALKSLFLFRGTPTYNNDCMREEVERGERFWLTLQHELNRAMHHTVT